MGLPLKAICLTLAKHAVQTLPPDRQYALAKTAFRCATLAKDTVGVVGEIREAWPTADERATAARRLFGRAVEMAAHKIRPENKG